MAMTQEKLLCIWLSCLLQHLDAIVSKELLCECESTNERDRFVIAVIKDGIMISHLLQKILHIHSLFL